jgi:hypothetical protein
MAALSCRAESLRNDGNAHANIADAIDRQQRVRCAGSDAGEVFAQQTGRLIGENNRETITRMRDNRARGTGLDAVTAFCTALQKERFIDSAGRPQPIGAERRRGLRWSGISVFGKFLRRSGDRENRVLEEIAPSI